VEGNKGLEVLFTQKAWDDLEEIQAFIRRVHSESIAKDTMDEIY
jgi:hypothetical protein